MTPFERLTSALQYQIVNGLGWTGLRPVQEQTIDAVLDGNNCVVLAPTAGGKTEAALFPLLSLMDAEDRRPVSVMYVAPIRALLNNQEPRLQQLAALIGRRAFKWHGDVGQSGRKRFKQDLCDILAITPESLEAMLISPSGAAQLVLENLEAVVIDEVHSFAAGDRGAHLLALLERVTRICRRDLQRIGLSATIGNPDAICDWLSGSSQRKRIVVNPAKTASQAELSLDYVGNLNNAAVVIERLHPGKKRLVFADSRRRVEELGHLLAARGVDAHVTHSSLAASERHAAERAFAEGQSCVIVATSALELGIDVGDLDHVLQIDAPATVSAFMQRMGRTGRRPGITANCTFLATDPDALLQAAALLRLYRAGFVEPVEPVRRGSHILAHQLMALTLQHGGAAAGSWWDSVHGAACFSGLTESDRAELQHHMLEQDILAEADGRLILGERGEKLYGRRHFMELYAVFSTPPMLTVMWGPREVGTLDSYFAHLRESEDLVFVLGGKPWQATYIDWNRGLCYVEPAAAGRYPTWMGEPRLLSWDLCQTMRDMLVDHAEDSDWSRRAREVMQGLRAEHAFLRDDPSPIIDEGERVLWWTYAGGKANNVLAAVLQDRLGAKVTASNITVTFTEGAAKSQAAIRQSVRELSQGAIEEVAPAKLVAGAGRTRLSKFQPCLPPRLEQMLLNDALLDAVGASRALQAVG